MYLPAFLALALASFAAAQPSLTIAELRADADNRIWIEGTSTVRSYRCESNRVRASATLNSQVQGDNITALAAAVSGGELSVGVATLDCGNGTMEGHMRKALLADQHPTIRFKLNRAVADGDALVLHGDLTIAGNTQHVQVRTAVQQVDGKTVRATGSVEILMSTHGVKPPTLMLGTMKVHDPVRISFDVSVGI
jgi:polyisoprenoid-binding protein YceI